MSKKGIILAGGNATRLRPITLAIPKSLVPLYNKPTIYYSLTTLLQQGCDDILIICKPEYEFLFKNLLGTGSQFDIKISYKTQTIARGLADAFLIGAEFINNEPVTMILGDNIFIGNVPNLESFSSEDIDAVILEIPVKDASQYGVYDYTTHRFIEKPKQGNYVYAIPGIYYFKQNACERASQLKPSGRGEIEITDLLQQYANENRCHAEPCRDVMWFDTGNFEDLADASNYIRFMENKLGIKVGDPYGILHYRG